MRPMIACRYLSQSLSTDSTDRTEPQTTQTKLRKAAMLFQNAPGFSSKGSQTASTINSIKYYQKPVTKTPPSRLLIRFHHEGVITTRNAPRPGFRQEVKEFLNQIWSEFGALTDTYYHRDFVQVYLTFPNRRDTFFAFDGLTDPIQVQVAICQAIGSDTERARLAKQIFIENGNGKLFDVEWA